MTRPKFALRRAYARDHMRLYAKAAVRERCVGGNHLDRRHVRRAQRDRGHGIEVGSDAEPMRSRNHRLGPDLLPQAHGDRVER